MCDSLSPCQQITDTKSCILPCLTQKLEIADNKSCILPCLPQKQQITGNKSYILSCLVQMPANHRQQIVHLAMPHPDTSKSDVKRKSSRGYDLLRALGSASCDITHETGDTSWEFPDLCFWCPKLMLFYSPEGFLTFVFGAQNSCFLRAQWVSWHLFGAQDSCFFLTAPTFAFGAQNSCTGCLRARRVSWHLLLAPKTHCFLRSQRASWHLLLVCKTHVFGEPRMFPDICFGAPNSCIFLKSPAGFLIFVFGSKTHAFWEVPKTHLFVRAQRVSWVPKTHNSGELRRFPDICFGTPKLMLFWEPNGFLDICVWCPRLMCFFWQPRHFLLVHKTPVQVVWEPGNFPDICFWRPKHMFLRSQRFSWHLLLVCKTHVFGEPRRFPDICFGAPNSCIVLKSPAGFLTFVFWFKNSCFLRARRVSWPLFLVPKTHAFLQPRRFPDICFWCPNVMLCWEPNGFPDICFWCPRLMCLFYSPDICFWCTKLLYRLFESPANFLTFVLAPKTHVFCLRSQRVSWHLLLVCKTHVFGEPRRFPDICFGAQISCFFESPTVFLTFVFGAQDSCVFFDSTDICFWCTKGEFPDICFWRPKHMFLRSQRVSWHLLLACKTHVFGEPRRFPDICFGAQNSCIVLKSPAGFLTFVFWFKKSCFLRAQRFSWPLFLVPKTHVFWEPGSFPDICFGAQMWCFVESPMGFLTFVFGAQDSCVFFTAPTFAFGAQNSCTRCLRARRVSWHLFWRPKHMFLITASFLTFVVGVQNSCFFESPEGFLIFVLVPKIHVLFQRARRVSWHLFFGSKTHAFWEPGEFPDFCFWCPKLIFFEIPASFLTFVVGVQNSCFWRAQKVSWHLFCCPKFM